MDDINPIPDANGLLNTRSFEEMTWQRGSRSDGTEYHRSQREDGIQKIFEKIKVCYECYECYDLI